MKHYLVAEIEITDPGWVADYVAAVTPLVERSGGRFLARTTNVERLEGERARPQTMLLIEWPSRDAAHRFYTSEEYAPYLRMRLAGARGEFFLVAGEDVTGAAAIER